MSNTPNIRFKGFADAWEWRKAKELCSIGTGKSNTQDQVSDGKYPFFIRSDVPVKSNKYLYDCEAVITIGDGNIGKVFHYVNGKFDLHQRCYKMTNFQDIWGRYFYYFFSAKFYDRAMKMSAKATVDSVRLEMISEMDILKPKQIAEQKMIAEYFTNLDNLITLHQRKCDEMSELKKFMLQKMFPKNGEQFPEIRFSGFTEPWEQRKLGEVYSFKYGEFNNNPDNGGKYPIYGANGIIGGYTEWNAENSSVIGHMGAYAGTVLWGEGKHFVTYNGTIARPLEDSFDSKFGYYVLLQKDINRICAGSGLPFLSYEQLNKIDIIYPSDLNEQFKIQENLTNLDNLITLHQRKCDELKELKKFMLQNMFPKKG